MLFKSILIAGLFLTGCATLSQSEPAPAARKSVTPAAQEPEYSKFIQTNECSRASWQRYDLANQMKKVANRGKVSPYEAVFGDAYVRRNMDYEAQEKMREVGQSVYLMALPNPQKNKLLDEWKPGGEKDLETDFNVAVQRDLDCYEKLK